MALAECPAQLMTSSNQPVKKHQYMAGRPKFSVIAAVGCFDKSLFSNLYCCGDSLLKGYTTTYEILQCQDYLNEHKSTILSKAEKVSQLDFNAVQYIQYSIYGHLKPKNGRA